MRYKKPDKKNALSILEAAQRDMKYILSLEITGESGATIVRNVYECFRMLGDSLLVAQGMNSEDHIAPINELMKLKVKTERPIHLVENLRRLRHNINYYGYKPTINEVNDVRAISLSLFKPMICEILKLIS